MDTDTTTSCTTTTTAHPPDPEHQCSSASEARRFTITYKTDGDQLVAVQPPARPPPHSNPLADAASSQKTSADNNNAGAANNHSSAAAAAPNNQPQMRTPYDYVFRNTIGEGSFSTVYLASDVHDRGREYAIKVCEKAQITRERKAQYILREKQVMAKINEHAHPFFVTLHATFQDEKRLYFVMSLAKNGEMLEVMRSLGSFDDDVTRFYASEIVVALEHLHSLGIIHRDLKPENILLTESMHIMISDFGSAKVVDPTEISVVNKAARLPEGDNPSDRRRSFVGTAQYVSPEVLNGELVSKSVDYWALGCIIYQMLAGLPPFRAATEFLIFQKITKLDYTFPHGFPETPKDLVTKLIVLDAADRLGMPAVGDAAALKSHPFFAGVQWHDLPSQHPPAIGPYLPASDDQPAFHSQFQPLPSGTKPGLDEDQVARLLTAQLIDCRHEPAGGSPHQQPPAAKPSKAKRRPEHLMDFNDEEKQRRLAVQLKDNVYHRFVQGNLILRSGLIDKKKGLFARKRMFLLTTGPHIFYVDPNSMELKGQILFTRHIRTEAKNFKTFFIHTPHRTYYLFDHENRAIEWCDAVDQAMFEVREHYWPVGCSEEPIGDELTIMDESACEVFHHPVTKLANTSTQSTSFSSTILRKISSAATARTSTSTRDDT